MGDEDVLMTSRRQCGFAFKCNGTAISSDTVQQRVYRGSQDATPLKVFYFVDETVNHPRRSLAVPASHLPFDKQLSFGMYV